MPKKSIKKTGAKETDEAYLLKVVLYFVLGLIWVLYQGQHILPIGFILGAIFARQDHFVIDRKIEYVILLVASIFGYAGWGPALNITGLGAF